MYLQMAAYLEKTCDPAGSLLQQRRDTQAGEANQRDNEGSSCSFPALSCSYFNTILKSGILNQLIHGQPAFV